MSPKILSRFSAGPGSRYAVTLFRNRFGGLSWLVEDRDVVDPRTGLPGVIRQEDSIPALRASMGDILTDVALDNLTRDCRIARIEAGVGAGGVGVAAVCR